MSPKLPIATIAAVALLATNAVGDDRQLPQLGNIQTECNNLGTTIGDFERLAQNGNLQAAYCLGLTSEVPGFEELGLKWLRHATERSYLPAQTALAQAHERRGEFPKAVSWYIEAALNGDNNSQLGLGYIAFAQWRQSGVEKHLINAWVWSSIGGADSISDFDKRDAKGHVVRVQLDELLSASQLAEAKEVKGAVLTEIANREIERRSNSKSSGEN